MGVGFGNESIHRVTNAQNNRNSSTGLSEDLGQNDGIEKSYWGALCISNIFAAPGRDEL